MASMWLHAPPSGSFIGRRGAAGSVMTPRVCAGVGGSFRYRGRAIGQISRKTLSLVLCTWTIHKIDCGGSYFTFYTVHFSSSSSLV